MAWSQERSRKRIEEFLKSVPELDENITLAKHRRMQAEALAKGLMDQATPRRAFVAEGAHLYGQVLDFETVLLEQDRETGASHRRALRFLNMHYRLWDAIVEDDDADRVDYHGSRLHAIATEPDGSPRGQIERAVALAAKLASATRRVAEVYGFPTRIRFGIDQGRCVAMTTGRAHDKDTLFLGAPANHAAKKAAESNEEGIFLANSAQTTVGSSALRKDARGYFVPARDFLDEAVRRNPFERIDRAADRLIAEIQNEPQFAFFRPTPPLADLKYADLSPSHTARASMASLFADIDGFTAFVDNAIAGGSAQIKRAVRNIHVIREELNAVLKLDFGGKRVRFIGDCIQGLVEEGEVDDDAALAISNAVLCATGMADSFRLCKTMLDGMSSLDLAIGVEYGPTPLTRLGFRGDESVRCATGRAVAIAEKMQQSLEHGGIVLGPTATALSTGVVKRHFARANQIPSYDSSADLLAASESPAAKNIRSDPSARSHTDI